MAEPTSYAYTTLTDFKPHVGLTETSEAANPVALRCIRTAAEAINWHCHRTFTPWHDTRAYTAPANAILPVDDLQDIVSITIAATPVTAYTKRTRAPLSPFARRSLYPHWASLRLAVGTWLALVPDGTDPEGAVIIEADYGFSAAVIDTISLANIALAALLWNADSLHWQDAGGGPGFPSTEAAGHLITGTLARMLQPFVLDAEAAL